MGGGPSSKKPGRAGLQRLQVTASADGQGHYRVYVGPVLDRESANRLRERRWIGARAPRGFVVPRLLHRVSASGPVKGPASGRILAFPPSVVFVVNN